MFTVTTLSWKYKISAIWLVVTAWIFLFAAVQTSMVYETQESLVGYTKHYYSIHWDQNILIPPEYIPRFFVQLVFASLYFIYFILMFYTCIYFTFYFIIFLIQKFLRGNLTPENPLFFPIFWFIFVTYRTPCHTISHQSHFSQPLWFTRHHASLVIPNPISHPTFTQERRLFP